MADKEPDDAKKYLDELREAYEKMPHTGKSPSGWAHALSATLHAALTAEGF